MWAPLNFMIKFKSTCDIEYELNQSVNPNKMEINPRFLIFEEKNRFILPFFYTSGGYGFFSKNVSPFGLAV